MAQYFQFPRMIFLLQICMISLGLSSYSYFDSQYYLHLIQLTFDSLIPHYFLFWSCLIIEFYFEHDFINWIPWIFQFESQEYNNLRCWWQWEGYPSFQGMGTLHTWWFILFLDLQYALEESLSWIRPHWNYSRNKLCYPLMLLLVDFQSWCLRLLRHFGESTCIF